MLYGLDIGGTKIELAIYDSDLNQLESWRVPTPGQDYQQFLTTVIAMVEQADAKTGETGSVGIGLPGFMDNRGCAVSANISCINQRPVATDLSQQLGRFVAFENDVKAFAVSEANGGAADGVKYALGLVLGTGLAGGLCIDGQLYQGKQNIAGEYGHIPLSAVLQQRYKLPLQPCGCGMVGCVERYLAGPGLLSMCSHFGADYSNVPALIKGVQNNEAEALTVFDVYVDCLGCYLAQLTLMFDPNIIVLGGGVSNVDELYPLLPVSIKDYLFEGVTPPRIEPPKFGDSSGVRGAAILGHKLKREMDG